MEKRKSSLVTVLVLLGLMVASTVLAAAPSWMPNFPMRLGTAGAMGMWMPVPGATEYKVLRKIGGGDWEEVYKGPVPSFQDPTAPNDQDVTYKVIAVVGGTDSEPSREAVLKGEKPVEPPAGLSHRIVAEQNSLLVRWNLVPGASFYNVYRGEAKDNLALLTSLTESKYTDAAVEDGKTYYYVITSVSATSQESKKLEPYEVKVVFPKVEVVKQYTPLRREMELLAKVRGEEFAEFDLPSSIVSIGERVYVAEKSGVQVLDREGNFIERLPVIQEKIAAKEWQRPTVLVPGRGNESLWLSTSASSVAVNLSLDGTQILGTVEMPQLAENSFKPDIADISVDEDGTLWLTQGYYTNVSKAAGNIPQPKEEDLQRIGFARGSKREKYEDELQFIGLVGAQLGSGGLLCGIESGNAKVVCIDKNVKNAVSADGVSYTPASAVKLSFGGTGGGLGQFNSVSKILPYEKSSVLVVDVLSKTIKQFNLESGDYEASYVDDPEKLNLTKPGSIGAIALSADNKLLYVLSGFESTLYIYELK